MYLIVIAWLFGWLRCSSFYLGTYYRVLWEVMTLCAAGGHELHCCSCCRAWTQDEAAHSRGCEVCIWHPQQFHSRSLQEGHELDDGDPWQRSKGHLEALFISICWGALLTVRQLQILDHENKQYGSTAPWFSLPGMRYTGVQIRTSIAWTACLVEDGSVEKFVWSLVCHAGSEDLCRGELSLNIFATSISVG